MAILIQDSFTDGNLVLLSDHVPEVGGAWVAVYGTGLWIYSNGLVWGDNNETLCVQHSVIDILDNGYVQVKKTTNGSRGLMIIFLYNEDTGIGVSLEIGPGAAGDLVLSGDTSQTFSGAAITGSTFRVEFTGGIVTLYKDAVSLGSVGVTSFDGGKFGIVNPGWSEGKSITKSFEGGLYHCLAIKTDKTFWHWGFAYNLNSPVPIQVPGIGGVGYLENIIKAGACRYDSCAIDEDGNAYAWGENSYGSIGDGTYISRFVPIRVKDHTGTSYLQGIINLSGGAYAPHILYLDSSGKVWAVGSGGHGQLGQGPGDTTNHPLVVEVKDQYGGNDFSGIKKIWAGACCSFALDEGNHLWAWGWNAGGQLGLGNTVNRYLPVDMNFLNVIDMDKGFDESHYPTIEAHMVACKSDGTCWAWGQNDNRQLGDGTTIDRLTPIQVKTGPGDYLVNIVQVAATKDNSFALDENGNVWGWGENDFGECGQGHNDVVPYAQKVKNISGQPGYLSNIVSIHAADRGSLYMLRNDGILFSIGRNLYGQLGDGTTIDRNLPVQVPNHTWWVETSCGLDDFEAGTTVAPIVEIEKALGYSRYILNWGPRANFSFRMRPRKRVWVGKNSQKTIRQTEPSLWTI